MGDRVATGGCDAANLVGMTIDAASIVRRHGGAAATHELYDEGFDRRTLATAVRRRELVRARQGWFCAPGTAPALIAAVRVGGRVTCRSALRLAGIWTRADTRLHVAVPSHAVRLRTMRSPVQRRRDVDDPGCVIHWSDPTGEDRLRVSAASALGHLRNCGDIEEVAAAADSILRLGLASAAELHAMAESLPSSVRHAIAGVDGICESGIETMLWRWMRRHRIDARRQVSIPTVGRIDFLLGRLVIEVDGRSYHSDPEQFEADRRRDARLSALGYRVLRFSYDQVTTRMSEVGVAILAAIARGDANE